MTAFLTKHSSLFVVVSESNYRYALEGGRFNAFVKSAVEYSCISPWVRCCAHHTLLLLENHINLAQSQTWEPFAKESEKNSSVVDISSKLWWYWLPAHNIILGCCHTRLSLLIQLWQRHVVKKQMMMYFMLKPALLFLMSWLGSFCTDTLLPQGLNYV